MSLRNRLIVVLIAVVPAVAGAGQQSFRLNLGSMNVAPQDPRSEQRLAEWNSPMGRLQYDLAEQRAGLGRSGLVGGSTGGVAVRVKLQRGFRANLVAIFQDAGTELYEQRLAPIRWPWSKKPAEPVPSLDEQLSELLGHRLTTR